MGKREKTDLWLTERGFFTQGVRLVCGADEAGAGPLAGPVFAAAVIFSPECGEIEGLDDSKKLSEKKREELFPLIQERALAWAVAMASEREIDELNILNARLLAIKRAVEALSVKPDLVLIDGNRCPELTVESRAIVGGDGKSASIAAASVLAKVSRDRHMMQLAEEYPSYGFQNHKGYPTAAHYVALRAFGPCPIHRMTFLKNV